MNARLYDPVVHRFLQVDNYIQDLTNTQNYNQYGYVLNNPLLYMDPSGDLSQKTLKSIFDNSLGEGDGTMWYGDGSGGFNKADGSGYVNENGDYTDAVALSNVTIRTGNGASKNASIIQNHVYANSQYYDTTNYGGDGSGSFMDYFSRFVYETDQFNPIALVWDGIKGNVTGSDRYGNKLSGFESNMKIVSAVPMTKVAGVAVTVSERGLSMMAVKAITTEGLATSATITAENAIVHGNSLKSLSPTWGYKLYAEDGTFLKNGITSAAKAESRYTQKFMADKYMDAIKFPNRLEAWIWEFKQNQILRGPLNKNMH